MTSNPNFEPQIRIPSCQSSNHCLIPNHRTRSCSDPCLLLLALTLAISRDWCAKRGIESTRAMMLKVGGLADLQLLLEREHLLDFGDGALPAVGLAYLGHVDSLHGKSRDLGVGCVVEIDEGRGGRKGRAQIGGGVEEHTVNREKVARLVVRHVGFPCSCKLLEKCSFRKCFDQLTVWLGCAFECGVCTDCEIDVLLLCLLLWWATKSLVAMQTTQVREGKLRQRAKSM
jgi:hypothetical protein